MRGSITKTSIKKQISLDNNRPMYGAKTVFIAHQATSGDTGIDLSSLNMPSNLYDKGYRNPSQKEIEELNLSFYSNYLKIVSSVKNELMKVSYDVVSGTQINFDGWTAEEGEIFEITFNSPPMGGSQYFDAQPLVKTYLLPEGETDVIIDDFEINKFPENQLGAVMVQRSVSGIMTTQFRNVGNSPTSEGNYYEVEGVAGVSKIIRFNTPASAGGDKIIVTSVGSLVQAPQQTFLSYIETMNGSQQKIINALEALGYDRNYFESLPNRVDLSSFGEKVYNLYELYMSKYPDESIMLTGVSNTGVEGNIIPTTIKEAPSGNLIDFTLGSEKVFFLRECSIFATCDVYALNRSNLGSYPLVALYLRDSLGNVITYKQSQTQEMSADPNWKGGYVGLTTKVPAGSYLHINMNDLGIDECSLNIIAIDKKQKAKDILGV